MPLDRLTNEAYRNAMRKLEIWKKKDIKQIALQTLPKQCFKVSRQ